MGPLYLQACIDIYNFFSGKYQLLCDQYELIYSWGNCGDMSFCRCNIVEGEPEQKITRPQQRRTTGRQGTHTILTIKLEETEICNYNCSYPSEGVSNPEPRRDEIQRTPCSMSCRVAITQAALYFNWYSVVHKSISSSLGCHLR